MKNKTTTLADAFTPRLTMQQLIDQNNALLSENATLRQTLFDACDKRDEYYQQLVTRNNPLRKALLQELDKIRRENSE